MASNLVSDGLHPNYSDGPRPRSDGLKRYNVISDGLQPRSDGLQPN